MGNEQSSNRGSAPTNHAPQKTDYYELLAVDRQATDDEYVRNEHTLSWQRSTMKS